MTFHRGGTLVDFTERTLGQLFAARASGATMLTGKTENPTKGNKRSDAESCLWAGLRGASCFAAV